MVLKIKILAITPFPPIINGGSLASYNLLSRLSRIHYIVVLTYQKGFVNIDNLAVLAANLGSQTTIFRGISFILFCLFCGSIVSFKGKPDVIYAKNLMSPGISATILSKLFRIPVVLHSSGTDVEAPTMNLSEMGFLGSFGSRILLKILHHEIRNASIIIANCREDALAIKKLDTGKGSILIYNGVNTKKFEPVKDLTKKKIRKKLRIPQEKPVIVTVAKPRTEKRYDRILRLANEVDATFILIGPTSDDLREYNGIPDNCRALGIVSNVDEYLKASDVFLLTSSSEGLSNAMLEAMSVGLPVVTTSVGEAKYLLNNFEFGYLADSHEERLAIINDLLKNPEKRRKMGTISRNYVKENHNWAEATEKIKRILEKSFTTSFISSFKQ